MARKGTGESERVGEHSEHPLREMFAMFARTPRTPANNVRLVRYVRKAPESCVFRALMRYEVKQHDFKMFEANS
jgi:hypothetical protein